MSSLMLFSLDALVSISKMYRNALVRACDGALDEKDASTMLGDRGQDVLGVIRAVFGRDPALAERLSKERVEEQVFATLHQGVHGCAHEEAYRALRDYKNAGYATGVFFAIEEPVLERVVKSAKLRVDLIAGQERGESVKDIILKAVDRSRMSEFYLVTASVTKIPDDIKEYVAEKRKRVKVLSALKTSQYSLEGLREQLESQE